MTEYRCFYRYLDFCTHKVQSILVPAIGLIRDGFWINEDQKYTTGEDSIEWIPPSQILLVKKETK